MQEAQTWLLCRLILLAITTTKAKLTGKTPQCQGSDRKTFKLTVKEERNHNPKSPVVRETTGTKQNHVASKHFRSHEAVAGFLNHHRCIDGDKGHFHVSLPVAVAMIALLQTLLYSGACACSKAVSKLIYFPLFLSTK